MPASFLFDNLSPTYNSVNAILSLGFDTVARKKVISKLKLTIGVPAILDLYSGTGNNIPHLLSVYPDAQIDAIDQSKRMITTGEKRYMNTSIHFLHSDFIEHDFKEKKYDAIICSYGLKCIPVELYHDYFLKLESLLSRGGQIVFLDIFYSDKKWLNSLFEFYFKTLLFVHPKVTRKLRSQYLELLDYMNDFNQQDFEDCLVKFKSFTTVKIPINIPMIRLYKITKR